MTAFWDKQANKEEKTTEPAKKASTGVAVVEKKTKLKKKAKKETSFSQAASIEKNIFFPIISEDAMNKQSLGKYVFSVNVQANKKEVKKAIFSRYGVDVDKVNILNSVPKKSFFKGKKGSRRRMKKAIVTLKKGETIEFFSKK